MARPEHATPGAGGTPPDRPAPDEAAAPAAPLEELRRILLEPASRDLEALRRRLDEPEIHASELARDLPRAMALRAREDGSLAAALAEPLGEGLAQAVAREPRCVARALQPLQGPLLRGYFLGGLARRLRRLERSVSPRAAAWRIQALLRLVPYERLVDEEDLVYRVEHVFLLERVTGVALQYVSRRASMRDLGAITELLAAIQKHVSTLHGARPLSEPRALELGERSVWIEAGPLAAVACAVAGEAPEKLGRVIRDALGRVMLGWSRQLEEFRGEPAPFEGTAPILESCLQAQYRSDTGRSTLGWALALGLLVLLGLGIQHQVREGRRFARWVESLRATPGIAVMRAERGLGGFGAFEVAGLRDPEAPDPASGIREAGLDPQRVRLLFAPYVSLDPAIVAARARRFLDAPPRVELKVEGDALVAAGRAPHGWIVEARKLARSLPGIARLDEEALVDADQEALATLAARIEEFRPVYPRGSASPGPADSEGIKSLAGDLLELEQRARDLDQRVEVRVVGYPDAPGAGEPNQGLALARARRVRDVLAELGFEARSLVATTELKEAASFSVRLEVVFRDRS